MRRALLALTAVVALAAILLVTVYTSGSNHCPAPDLKPGSIITLEEIERLGESGWRLVGAEQVYRLYGFTAVYGACNTSLLLVDGLKPSEWGETGPQTSSPETPRRDP